MAIRTKTTNEYIMNHLIEQDKIQKLVNNRANWFAGLIFSLGMLTSTVFGLPPGVEVKSFCDLYFIAMIVIEVLAIFYCFCNIRKIGREKKQLEGE